MNFNTNINQLLLEFPLSNRQHSERLHLTQLESQNDILCTQFKKYSEISNQVKYNQLENSLLFGCQKYIQKSQIQKIIQEDPFPNQSLNFFYNHNICNENETFEKLIFKTLKKTYKQADKLQSNDDKNDQQYTFESKRSKGLRNLSLQVLDIVCLQKQTSYKQVAEKLIFQIQTDTLFKDKDIHQQKKDEQNIKRRVYDALNVLIAAFILRKDGKNVICNNQQIFKSRIQRMTVIQIEDQLKQKRLDCMQKKQKLQKQIYKMKSMIYLTQSNKENDKERIEQRIHFPFIIVKVKGDQIDNINFYQTQSMKKVIIISKDQLKITGETDAILSLNYNEKFDEKLHQEDFFEQDMLKIANDNYQK